MNLTFSQIDEFIKRTTVYEYKELIFLKDLFLIPLTLFILYFILKKYKTKQPEELRKYYILGYFVKLIGLPLFLIHHTYIYTGGVDSFTYFWSSNELIQLLYIKPQLTLEILFSSNSTLSPSNYNFNLSGFTFAPNECFTIKLSTIISALTGNSYFVTGLITSFFAYLGCWKILVVFNKIYPGNAKLFAITTIFIPSVIFWTSVAAKEVYCIGAMGYFFYYLIEVFKYKKNTIINSIKLIVLGYILIRIKIYILIAFIVAFLFYLLFAKIIKIKSYLLRYLSLPILLLTFIFLLTFVLSSMESVLQQFALNNILDTIKITYDYLAQDNFASSRYDLGTIDPTIAGVAKLAPAGINVTLFRPYIWEANKPITLIAALESLITLLLTLFVLYKSKFRFIKYMFKDNLLIFCIVFALIFSLAVGITSGNFGTLMRYKIPMMPFYYSALAIIYIKSKENIKTEIAKEQE